MSRPVIVPLELPIVRFVARRVNVESMALPQITWDDVLQMPEDGNRYEAIDGELYVTPAPSSRHQEVSMALAVGLHGILVAGEHGRLFHAPYGVKFPSTGEGVQPDLVFVSGTRRDIVRPAQIEGVPDLVVEILSPSTAGRDRGVKRKLYERQGVREYWIVDADAGAIDVWRFAAGETQPQRFTERIPVRVGDETVGELDLGEVFRRV